MLVTNLRITFRNLKKDKLHTFINIIGLGVGIASVLFIVLFVVHEKSYDRFHSQHENIYRVTEEFFGKENSGSEIYPKVPWPVATAMANDYPEIKAVRIFKPFKGYALLSTTDQVKRINEEKLFIVDSTFFDIFSFQLVKGNPKTALENPRSIVLTEAMAEKYFGTQDVLGKLLVFENAFDLTVTGIAKNVPSNSHFHFDFLVSSGALNDLFTATGNPVRNGARNWFWTATYTYVLLPDAFTPGRLETLLPDFAEKYFPTYLFPDKRPRLHLQKLADIHLQSHLPDELESNRSEATVYTALALAILILVIASLNFISLSATKYLQRGKEVSIRKVLGSFRIQLIVQFLTESFIICILSLVVGIGLLLIGLPLFEHYISGHSIHLVSLITKQTIFLILLGIVALSFLAGIFPALKLSAYQPVEGLRSNTKNIVGERTPLFSQLFIVFQFSISAMLIVAAAMMAKQHIFLQSKELGFLKEEIVLVPISGTSIKPRMQEFKDELKKSSAVISASAVSDILGEGVATHQYHFSGLENPVEIPGLFTDHDFLKTFGISLTEGRDFSEAFSTDDKTFLVNQAALPLLNNQSWEETTINWKEDRPIIGITHDFNFADLRSSIQPLVITMDNRWISHMAVRVSPGSFASVVNELENAWKLFEPQRPFELLFLNDQLNTRYHAEKEAAKLVTHFSLLAVFIASMGLLGLAAYSTQLRLKEIAIRKILGCTIPRTMTHLTKHFLFLIVLANVIGLPMAYYGITLWLENFTYKAPIQGEYFVMTLFSTLLIGILIPILYALKAALVNPILLLRED